MRVFRTFSRIRSDETTGFGSHSKDNTGRFYARDGSPNVKKTGLSWFENVSWYHWLLGMPLWKFLLLIFLVYLGINVIFTLIYFAIGIDHLAGAARGSLLTEFLEMFFFSTQTFTTVGYGRISPVGALTSFVATFEAFIGLLGFAIATGLFFARFSMPRSHIRYSSKALISPYQGGKALMFRLASYKNNKISDVEVRMLLAVSEEENGVFSNKFYTMETTIKKINMLSLSWTVVHPIDENSPLYKYSEEMLAETPMEIMIFLKGYDEVYSNQVVSRTSYTSAEVVYGAKFKIMYFPDKKHGTTVLDFSLLDSYDLVQLP